MMIVSNDIDVLYIEDNKDNRTVMEALIRRSLGIEIQSVNDAEEGLSRCDVQIPDIILMDIRLPGMNGTEAIRQLKNNPKTKDVPVIAVSADAMSRCIDETLEAGADEFIVKPFGIDELVTSIRKYCHV